MARCACIDIGSNTTRLLVVEGDVPRPRELRSEREFTRLGSAREATGRIGADKIAEVAAIVARQVAVARELDVSRLRIVATSAIRGAPDAPAMRAAIAERCAAPLEILSGEQEARLAFNGAVGMLAAPPSGEIGVIDVGGGSTELVVGSAAGGVTWSVSLPLGSAVVTDRHLRGDPPSAIELAALRGVLADAFSGVDAPQTATAYAVGGSATSLQRLLGRDLHRDALSRGLTTLVSRPAAQVALALGLHAERARLLPAGLLLLDAAARSLQAPLRLAGGGLREGIVLEQLADIEASHGDHTTDAVA